VAHADHVEPHAQGGPTSTHNGQGLCVRCNIVKEQPGWRSAVVHPGPLARESIGPPGPTHREDVEPAHTVRVTTPTGHSYVSSAPPVLPGEELAGSVAAGRRRRRRAGAGGHGQRFEVYVRDDVDVFLAEAG
jgi:hypothetical protein